MRAAGKIIHDFSYDLVAGDNVCVERREFAFDNMQVGAANTTGQDAEQDMARRRFRFWDIFNPEGRL